MSQRALIPDKPRPAMFRFVLAGQTKHQFQQEVQNSSEPCDETPPLCTVVDIVSLSTLSVRPSPVEVLASCLVRSNDVTVQLWLMRTMRLLSPRWQLSFLFLSCDFLWARWGSRGAAGRLGGGNDLEMDQKEIKMTETGRCDLEEVPSASFSLYGAEHRVPTAAWNPRKCRNFNDEFSRFETYLDFDFTAWYCRHTFYTINISLTQ